MDSTKNHNQNLKILQKPKNFSPSDFLEFANTILNHILIYLPLTKNKKAYRICEIEFYLFNNKTHKDNYVHCSLDQLKWQKFYFHQFKNGSYKSGTYKGMDMTFGVLEREIYFGVLIRSIMDMETGEFIEGPCRSVNKILEIYQSHDVKEFLGKFVSDFKGFFYNFG